MAKKTFFGFGVAPSMFPTNCGIAKRGLSPEQAKAVVAEGVEACLNPSHKASIDVMTQRFGIEVAIPTKAPSVKLENGDQLLVMGVSGLPRLENRHSKAERFSIHYYRLLGWFNFQFYFKGRLLLINLRAPRL